MTASADISAGWHRRAALASHAGATERAIACYDRVLAVAPADVKGMYYRGFHSHLEGDLPRAASAYRRALSLDPGHSDAAWCLAMLRWLEGDLAEAWKTYERRLTRTGFEIHPEIARRPAWHGEPLPGRTLLLWAEQGNGDTIHFIRYAAAAKQRVGRLVVACQRPLGRLLAAQPALADVVVGDGEVVPPFDAQASIMSLPVIFGTDMASIPGTCPYLAAPSRRTFDDDAKFRVGLVWGGNPHNQPMDRYRSIPFPMLAPLLSLPGMRCYSLQVGPHTDEARPYFASGAITDLSIELTDFAETARALAGLDLMVTIDTSVAHLAGALARPTFLMLAKTPDYRWHLAGDRSPWYPTARLFRQAVAGDWAPVIERVARAIGEVMPRGRGPQ